MQDNQTSQQTAKTEAIYSLIIGKKGLSIRHIAISSTIIFLYCRESQLHRSTDIVLGSYISIIFLLAATRKLYATQSKCLFENIIRKVKHYLPLLKEMKHLGEKLSVQEAYPHSKKTPSVTLPTRIYKVKFTHPLELGTHHEKESSNHMLPFHRTYKADIDARDTPVFITFTQIWFPQACQK